MTNMRFHAIALSGIILTVIAIFALTGKLSPKPAAQAGAPAEEVYVPGNRLVTIWEASWGLNCNESIERERRYAIPGAPTTPLVPKNNVQEIAGKICNGKETCEIIADSKIFGPGPKNTRCRPELDLTYRCYDIERPTMLHVRFGDKITINCKDS